MNWREAGGELLKWGGLAAGVTSAVALYRRAFPSRPQRPAFDWSPEAKEAGRKADAAGARASRLMNEAGGKDTRHFPQP